MVKKRKIISSEGLNSFEWPEFRTDKERIRAYSNRYKNMGIVESFATHYGINFGDISERANQTPQDLRIGDIINTKIISIDKNRVNFDTLDNQKTDIQSCINLYKYEKFKHFIPIDTIRAKVTKIDKTKVTIDPLAPILEDWLKPILNDINIQKVIPNQETNQTLKTIKVKDLQLTRGGFTGKAVIPTVSEFVGEDYVMNAFIPGSQIVLNITDDFEQFIGKSVDVFVMNHISKPGSDNEMSLICSAKEVIKFNGELNMIQLFNSWCEESELWKTTTNKSFEGKVTGVINSSKKCGVFVEIPELSITGMVAVNPKDLVNYKPHMTVAVKIEGFDEETYFNQSAQQMQHMVPYEIEDGILKKCNLKPILQFE